MPSTGHFYALHNTLEIVPGGSPGDCGCAKTSEGPLQQFLSTA